MFNLINRLFPTTLFVVRGVPGTGKSTTARKLTRYVVEADMYPGRYLADSSLNPEISHQQAHDWCRQEAIALMKRRVRRIAVANTLCRRRYADEWINLAMLHGYQVRIVDCSTEYGSIHAVPEEIMSKMRSQWEIWNAPR